MFCHLTRWLDRLIPFDFQVEEKPGAKIGLADYLSGQPTNEATLINTFDNMFTLAKINSIRNALGFVQDSASSEHQLRNNASKGPHIYINNQRSINRFENSSRNKPVEGVKSCERKLTNQKRENGLNQRLRNTNENLVSAITQLERSCSKFSNLEIHIKMDRSMMKLEKFLKKDPSLDSKSDENYHRV